MLKKVSGVHKKFAYPSGSNWVPDLANWWIQAQVISVVGALFVYNKKE